MLRLCGHCMVPQSTVISVPVWVCHFPPPLDAPPRDEQQLLLFSPGCCCEGEGRLCCIRGGHSGCVTQASISQCLCASVVRCLLITRELTSIPNYSITKLP